MGGEPLQSPPRSTESIEQLIAPRDVRAVFQPIIDGSSSTVIDHEALTRGPPGDPYESPGILLAHAALPGRNGVGILENNRNINILAMGKPGPSCLVDRQGQIPDLSALASRTACAPRHDAVTPTRAATARTHSVRAPGPAV
jgi:hypothetical protein